MKLKSLLAALCIPILLTGCAVGPGYYGYYPGYYDDDYGYGPYFFGGGYGGYGYYGGYGGRYGYHRGGYYRNYDHGYAYGSVGHNAGSAHGFAVAGHSGGGHFSSGGRHR